MKCIIIFDSLNDIIYAKYNRKFAKHMNKYARSEGLLPSEMDNDPDIKLATNVLMQIFSPIVTSQRIMSSQFGNSYTSCQCQNGLNMAFEEYMGFVLINISQEDVADMKKFLGICISFVRHLCGANVSLLQSNKATAATFTKLLDTWLWLKDNDQAILVEAVEQLSVNKELSATTLSALQEATEKLKNQLDHSKMHAMILVHNKFLSLYSSRNASDISASDILFLSMLVLSCRQTMPLPHVEETDTDGSDEFFSPSASPELQSPPTDSPDDTPVSYQVLLMGTEPSPKCLPHAVHILPLNEDINLVVMIESGFPALSSGLYESFLYLNLLQTIQIQRDIEAMRPVFENLDTAIKKTSDGLKKLGKQHVIEACHKILTSKWDFMRKKYQEFIRNKDSECLLKAESSTGGLVECLRELLQFTCFDTSMLYASSGKIYEIGMAINDRLAMFSDFLKAKAMKNLSLGSRSSLTINKYLEEFPGMVHFLYIDRTNHRITAPSLDFNSEETVNLIRKKIWSMVKFTRCHLQQGNLSIMWKDTTFNYVYFLWFEDKAGSSLKPRIFPTNSPKALPQPGIICGDFYQRLIEVCFPKMSMGNVRCFELFCIHLGLATSSVVLEQTRRLAATIWEVTGIPSNPIDLL